MVSKGGISGYELVVPVRVRRPMRGGWQHHLRALTRRCGPRYEARLRDAVNSEKDVGRPSPAVHVH